MNLLKNVIKLYLDTCCYCRPFDNWGHWAQLRVQQEITVIMYVVKMCGVSGIPIIGSAAVDAEIEDIKKDDSKRKLVRAFYERTVTKELTETTSIIERARELNAQGIYGEFDSYHVAFAEADGVDFLLTTDNRFERAASKLDLKTMVINPINFLGEHIIWLLSLT